MVFVTMGQEDAPQFILVLHQVGDIRDDQVDAQHIVFGEHEARIEQDHVIAITEHGHVLADFAQTA